MPAGHESLRALIVQGGATPVIEHGMLIGEVRGLEVCRVVDRRFHRVAQVEVGIGQHDREAFQLCTVTFPTIEALRKVVPPLAPHRQEGAAPHPGTDLVGSGHCVQDSSTSLH